ncbi:hypothetical protein DVH05_008632 [Phytophthora capsici]|nr:hypothetical protein DVH05_008632 [Phytophthora capsici]
MSQTSAFRDFIIGMTANSSATVLAANTYNDILDTHYRKFQKETTSLLKTEFELLHNTRFIMLMHDLWTNSAKNCIVGVSISFIDHTWVFRYIALLAVAKNDGHDAKTVAKTIDSELKNRFDLDVETMVKFTISDTAPAARKTSREFDTALQTDCTMHLLNLCIGYGVGLKENVQNQLVMDPVTKRSQKQRTYVTKGGQFGEGAAVIRKLRTLNNYFASSTAVQRGHRLASLQRFNSLPELAGLVDVDVRVASVVKLFRRSIVNYAAYKLYFETVKDAKDDKAIFSCISSVEWKLVIEMEAIVNRLAQLALVESQAANILSSTMYALLRVAAARIKSYKFQAYQLDAPRDEDTNESNFRRIELTYTNISQLGRRCIARTLHQIAQRLPAPSVPIGMALLLDPRTKRTAKNYLSTAENPEAHAETILAATKELLYTEHREMYRLKHSHSANEDNSGTSSVSNSPGCEVPDASDTEMSLLCGEEVSPQSEQSLADSNLAKEADAVVDMWLDLRVEWGEVAKSQYKDADKRSEVLGKLSMPQPNGKRVWNVERLCEYIDVRRWFIETGERAFPTIAMLARTWLGRSCSTAFQERVFSTGSFVMSPLRSRTDNERAHKQLILRHNREEINRMSKTTRSLW